MASETLTDLTDRYLMQDKLGWKLSGWATKRAFPGLSGSSYEKAGSLCFSRSGAELGPIIDFVLERGGGGC